MGTSRCVIGLLGLQLAAAGLSGCGTPFQSTDRVILTVPVEAGGGGRPFVITNPVGDIRLQCDPAASEIRAVVEKTGRGLTAAAADEARDEIRVVLAASGDAARTIEARAEQPDGTNTRQYSTDWEITAPAGMVVTIKAAVGDVQIAGCTRGAAVSTGVGDVRARAMSGGLRVASGVGDVVAEAAGDVSVTANVGDVRLTSTSPEVGDVSVRTNVGDVVLKLPASRQGLITTDASVGEVRVRMGGVPMSNMRMQPHYFRAKLGQADKPCIEASADVGDVVIQTAG